MNSDYTAFDNMVVHILVKSKQCRDPAQAVSMDAEQNCLLEMAGLKTNLLWSRISHPFSPCNHVRGFQAINPHLCSRGTFARRGGSDAVCVWELSGCLCLLQLPQQLSRGVIPHLPPCTALQPMGVSAAPDKALAAPGWQ